MYLYCLCMCVHTCVTHNVLKYACVCVVSAIGGLSVCHLAAQEDVEAYFHDGSSAPLCPPFCGPNRPLYQSLCSPLRTSHNTRTHTQPACVFTSFLSVTHYAEFKSVNLSVQRCFSWPLSQLWLWSAVIIVYNAHDKLKHAFHKI